MIIKNGPKSREDIKMKKKSEIIETVVGSGNVFRDLGDPNPEESQAKADLAIQIRKIIEQRGLTQKEAAEIMEIDQPKVSDIIRGYLFSGYRRAG